MGVFASIKDKPDEIHQRFFIHGRIKVYNKEVVKIKTLLLSTVYTLIEQ